MKTCITYTYMSYTSRIFYRPQTKLLEGNVFTRVCVFTWGSAFPQCHDLRQTPTPSESRTPPPPPPPHPHIRSTDWLAVRILLECILVKCSVNGILRTPSPRPQAEDSTLTTNINQLLTSELSALDLRDEFIQSRNALFSSLLPKRTSVL